MQEGWCIFCYRMNELVWLSACFSFSAITALDNCYWVSVFPEIDMLTQEKYIILHGKILPNLVCMTEEWLQQSTHAYNVYPNSK